MLRRCLDGIKKLFGHRHAWVHYQLRSTLSNLTYFCRKCTCGAEQIQNAGPTGDSKWHDRVLPVAQRWERDDIGSATLVEYPDDD